MSHSPSTRADYLITDSLTSRQAVEDLRKKFNLTGMFRPAGADPLMRFWWDDGTAESLARYWRNMVVDAQFDVGTGIGVVRVRAFSPQDSLKLAQATLELGEKLVAEADLRSRQEAVRFAEAAFARAEKRMDDLFDKQQAYRREQLQITPGRSADELDSLIGAAATNLSSSRNRSPVSHEIP